MSAKRIVEIATIFLNNQHEATTNVEETKPKHGWLRTYFSKWTGQHAPLAASSLTLIECIISFIGAFIGVVVLTAIHYRLLTNHDLTLFIASFGATAVLVYGLPSSPLSQPRSVIGGQVISAIVGCTIRLIFGERGELFVAVTLSVCLTLLLMQLTKTMHAPAGATAVIAVTASTPFPWAGYQFVLMPVLSSSIILVLIGVIVNNVVSNRHYPCFWW